MLNPFLLILLLLLTTHSLQSSNGSLTLCSLRNGVDSNQQEVKCQSNRYSNQSIANQCVQVYSNETAYFQIIVRNSGFKALNILLFNMLIFLFIFVLINHIHRLTETINLLKETHALQTLSLKKQLKDQKSSFSHEIKAIKDETTRQNNKLRQEMMKIVQQNKNNQDKSLSLIQNNEIKTNTLGSILNQLNLVSIVSPIDNPDRYKFAVYNYTPKSYYVQKVTSNSWSNFILPPLTSGTITTFTMRILSGQWFNLGICTRNVFGKMLAENYDNHQTILYCPTNGYMHANGKRGFKATANLYGEGTVIEMLVDTVRWSVTWTIDNKQTISAVILDRMRGQTLFPQFMIGKQGEAFELMK